MVLYSERIEKVEDLLNEPIPLNFSSIFGIILAAFRFKIAGVSNTTPAI